MKPNISSQICRNSWKAEPPPTFVTDLKFPLAQGELPSEGYGDGIKLYVLENKKISLTH